MATIAAVTPAGIPPLGLAAALDAAGAEVEEGVGAGAGDGEEELPPPLLQAAKAAAARSTIVGRAKEVWVIGAKKMRVMANTRSCTADQITASLSPSLP